MPVYTFHQAFFTKFILFVRCIFLELTQQPTDALNKMKFVTNIDLLHVSAPGAHPKGVFQSKGIKGIAWPSLA